MKITILTYLEKANDLKSYDVVVDQVAAALKQGKHQVSILGIHDDIKELLDGLARRKPDLVFNLVETFGKNVPRPDTAIAGVLDAAGYRYTGGGPGELFIRQDKSLAKKLLHFDKILYPDFAVFSHDKDLETGGNLRMPFFVKPLQNDASIGISGKNLVNDAVSLMKQVALIHEKFKDSALVEEYIEGREFYVGVLGNRDPQALPPIEMDFSGLPADKPRVLDSKAKWDKNSVEYKGTKSVLAQLPDDLKAKLQKTALEAARALRLRDYGRVDLRLTDTLDVYVIEVNANCYLEQSSEFAMAAAAAGMDYPALINKIVDLATERYAPVKTNGNGAAKKAKPKRAKKKADI
jgi:D-alanine-D-alanine ligase